MADKITNDITLLFKTKLDEKSKQEVGKNLKSLLENAAIGFDEAETKRNLEPIVKMMKGLFDKAEIAFDADQLLAMPSRQALQKMAEIDVKQLQLAFDKALAKSGGIKIDFGDMDLSAMTEPLERLTQELSEIGERVANTTKKSVREIENSINGLSKLKSKKINVKVLDEEGVEQEVIKEVSQVEQTIGNIEKTLSVVNNPKHYTSAKRATTQLESAHAKYAKSVADDDPWEIQYQHLLTFVTRYEAMSKKIKPLVDMSNPEFKQLYEMLSPKAGAAKISLEHFVDIAQGNELREYKNQPWARENTLKKIEQTLRNGITVKDGPNDGQNDDSGNNDSTPPRNVDDDNKEKKSPRTKVPIVESPNVDADEQARIEAEKKAQAEKVAAEAAKQRRIEEEKAAEAVKKIVVYRGIIPPEDEGLSLSRRQVLDEKDGAEWWATNKNAAQTYADIDKGGAILVGAITPKNPLIIDAGGRNYDDFGNMPGIKNITNLLPQLAELIASKVDITDIQKYINTRAKELGHDAVQFDNVNDVLNPSAFKELGSTFAVLDDSILEVNSAFAQLKYDVDEGLGDYSKKATVDNIPGYYKAPEKKLQTTKDVQVVSEASAVAAQEELETTVKTTAELEKQKKLLLYRRVEGEFDPDRISSRSGDTLYDKHGKPSIQQALEFDFGGFGDGLCAATLSGSQDLIPLLDKDGVSFFEFDASGYNFFINNTVEQAEILRTFLSSLQKFIGSGTILDASKLTNIEDLSEEELYEIALKLFDNFNMTKEQFYSWIEDAKSECTNISELFAQGKTPQNHHNFGTRFMQTLGYDGVLNDTEDESYNGNFQGSVIFDPDIDKVKASAIVFKTTKEYLERLKTASENASQSSEVCLSNLREETKAHQDNATAINNEAEAKQSLQYSDEQPSDSGDTSLDAEITQIRETSTLQLEAISNEKTTLQNDLDLARQQAQSAQDEVTASQARKEEANQKLAEQEALNRQLREQLANVKTGANKEAGASIGADDLKRILGEVVYRVQIAQSDTDKGTNKIALDETALEEALKRVFSKFINPAVETSESRQEVEPWALDKTLLSVKEVLGQIQTNTAQKQALGAAPVKTKVGGVPTTKETLTAIKTAVEDINSKIVKGAKATTKDTIQSQKTSANRDAQILTERIETQKLALKKFKTELETSGRMTDEMSKKIRGLAISLGMVKDNKGLTRWGQKFQQQKLSVGITDIGNKESIADQNANIKEWISLSKKLGELDAKINSGLFDDTIILQAKQEREFVLKRIDDLMELINNPNDGFIAAGEANFAGHYDATGVQRSKLVGQLASKYDRLGELEARAETSGAFEDREKYSQLEKEIQAEVEKLRLNEEQNAELLKILQERQEIAYINAKDVEYAKEQKRLFTEYVNLVKQIGKLDGVINSDTEDKISKLNAQTEKDTLMRLVDDIRPQLDLTREDLISATTTSMQGEETSTIHQRQTALTNLAKQYKELGKLQAQEAHTQVAELQKKIDAQRIVLKLTQEEQDALTQITENARQDALNKQADKDAKKNAADAKKLAKRQAMTGKAGSAIGRAESTWLEVEGLEQANLPEGFKDQVNEYYEALDQLRSKLHEVNISEVITDEQQSELIKQTAEVNKLTEAIGPLVAQYERLSGKNTKVLGVSSLSDESTLEEYEQGLRQAVMAATNGQAQIKGFDNETKTLTYTLKTGKHEFTEYTAEVRKLDQQYTSTAGKTKKIETFFEATKRKIGEISSYVTGMGAINLAKNQLKQGIQYIKEIDDALTELKKVTDETEETYDKFLKTASKTADKLGSTMQEVISSTADFSRVGYTLEQSATLAESALTLMNTSEYTDIGSASEALISALKAYGYAAEESMHVVDIFNEIGENYCRCA